MSGLGQIVPYIGCSLYPWVRGRGTIGTLEGDHGYEGGGPWVRWRGTDSAGQNGDVKVVPIKRSFLTSGVHIAKKHYNISICETTPKVQQVAHTDRGLA